MFTPGQKLFGKWAMKYATAISPEATNAAGEQAKRDECACKTFDDRRCNEQRRQRSCVLGSGKLDQLHETVFDEQKGRDDA